PRTLSTAHAGHARLSTASPAWVIDQPVVAMLGVATVVYVPFQGCGMSRIHEVSECLRQGGELAAVLDAAYDAFEAMLTCIRAVEDPDEQIGRRGRIHQPRARVR